MKIRRKTSKTETQENENMKERKNMQWKFGENNVFFFFLMEHKNVIKEFTWI